MVKSQSHELVMKVIIVCNKRGTAFNYALGDNAYGINYGNAHHKQRQDDASLTAFAS